MMKPSEFTTWLPTMPRSYQYPSALSQALVEEGLVPEECGDIEISLPVDGVVTLTYRVFVRVVDMEKLGRAFAKAAQLDAESRT